LISSCRTVKGVKSALENIPSGLYETYAQILKTIDEDNPDISRIARRTLMWLVGSLRPLTLREIVEAIMIQPGEQHLDEESRVFDDNDILNACKSLVYYNEHDGILRLSHVTVKVEWLSTVIRPS
jgi:hypothetical protein